MESIGNPLITPSMKGWPGFPRTLNMDPVTPYPYIDNPYRYPHHNQFQSPGKMRTLYGSPPLMDSQKSFGNPKLSKPQVVEEVPKPTPAPKENRYRLYEILLLGGGLILSFGIPFIKQLRGLSPQVKQYLNIGGTLMIAASSILAVLG